MHRSPDQNHWFLKEECLLFYSSLPDAVVVIDSQETIVYINSVTEQLLGYTAVELEGQALNTLLPERFHETHRHLVAHYYRSPWPRPMGMNLDLVARHKQGHEIPVIISLLPYKAEQGFVIVAFIRDMSEYHKLQNSLHEKQQQLEKLVDEKIGELHLSNETLQAEIVKRMRLEEQLRLLNKDLVQRQELLSGELANLEKYSSANSLTVTSHSFQLEPLAESLPDIFADMVAEYGELLDQALAKTVYKVETETSDRLRVLADKLGFLHATPQDVVLLHSHAIKEKSAQNSYSRANAYFLEGRLVVLKLMGYLAAHYRNYSLHISQQKIKAPRNEPVQSPKATEE